MIEILINGYPLDIDEKTVIAPTFQSANIAEWNTVQSDYTNTFKVSITQKNKRIFDNINVFNYLSSFNQSNQNCVIKNDGIEFFSGYANLKEKDENYFSLVVFGGNFNFFAKVKDLFLHQIDTTDYDFTTTFSNYSSLINANEGVVVPIVNYGTNDVNFNVSESYFSFYVKTIIQKIFDATDFDYEGRIFQDTFFNKLVIPFSNKTYKICLLELQDVNRTLSLSQTPTNLNLPTVFNNGFSETAYTYEYNLTNELSFELVLDIEFYELTDYVKFIIQSNTVFEKEYLIAPKIGAFREKIYFKSEDIKQNDTVSFVMQSLNANAYMRIKKIRVYGLSEIDKRLIDTFPTFIESKILINENLPNIKQTDFIKEIAKLFGLVFTSQNYTVTFTKIRDVFFNTYESNDFSKKLDLSKPINISYSYENYAQTNIFQYQNDATVFEQYGQFDAIIKNTTLGLVNNFIKSFFGATNSSRNKPSGKNVAFIDYITIDDSGDISLNDVSPRILFVEESTDALTMIDSYGNSTSIGTYKEGQFVNANHSLMWSDLFNSNYDTLFNSLNDIKVVDCYIDVSTIDIQQFNFNKLIYINFFNSFFYVVMIDKVMVGKSTKFTLLKV